MRIRSYVPLKGKGLRLAVGDCPNPLLKGAVIKQPLKQQRIEKGVKLNVPKVYEYDLDTQTGQTYTF